MKKLNQINILPIIIIFIISLNTEAQDESEVIHKTLQAEIQRNMDGLFIEDMQKPFYIGLNLVDYNNICVKSTLGFITRSSENSAKRIYLPEVYVGNYDLTNLNYMDMTTQRNARRIPTGVPIETSSDGISKALWSAIDKAYKLAAESYEAKMSAMKEQVISEEEKNLSDFSKEKITNIHLPMENIGFNKMKLENMSKELSALFKKYPEIYASYVTFTGFKSNIYFSNSEGSSATYPVSGIRLVIYAKTQAIDGEELSDELCYYAVNEEEIPIKETIVKDIDNMVDHLLAMRQAPVFDDMYNGPVLFIDQAAYEIFAKSVSSLNSSRKIICGDDRTSNMVKKWTILNSNLDKKMTSKYLNIIAYPQLKKYENTKLLGYFPVDMQGIAPPDKLVLIENGILKTLFSSRQIGIGHDKSNGHLRFGYNNSYPGIGPSVVALESQKQMSLDELKQKLIDLAIEDELDYAIIIKKMRKDKNDPIYVYKVDLETGKEELVRTVQIEVDIQDYKRLGGTSNNKGLYNVFVMEHNVNSEYISGLPASFITYDGILFKSIEVKKAQKPINKKLPIVENPVKLKF